MLEWPFQLSTCSGESLPSGNAQRLTHTESTLQLRLAQSPLTPFAVVKLDLSWNVDQLRHVTPGNPGRHAAASVQGATG